MSERLDDLGNGYFIFQDPDYFCFGIDAVLLSSFTRVYEGERVLDLCSGNGIIPILLAAKTKASHIFGVEIQKAPSDMALRSVLHNNLGERISIINGDLRDCPNIPQKVDVVTVNPPYMKCDSGAVSDHSPLAIARHEISCTFEDIVRISAKVLKVKGRFYTVHRPFRIVSILKTMTEAHIEPKSIRFVQPYVNKEPNLVLIEGIKGASEEVRIAPPLVVYDSPGQYTREVLDIYGYE